ncbi:MAG: hypothetical protein K5930_06890 [Treponemataceae bacterium]|nr:hypothetical protein [Treponemataceae bacterium]
MKAIIKQDFLRRRSGALISSLVLLLINALVIIANIIAKNNPGIIIYNESGATHYSSSGFWAFLDFITPVVMMIDTLGVFFWTLEQGASNIGKDLKSDVGYLYKMVPKSGWNILGGKLILGLAEFTFYAIQAWIYLVIITNVTKSTGFMINGEPLYGIESFLPPFILVVGALVQFITGATLLGFVSIAATAFLKNRRFRGVLVTIAIFALAIFIGRVIAGSISGMNPETIKDSAGWITYGIEMGFSCVFFVLSCILWEKKVSV